MCIHARTHTCVLFFIFSLFYLIIFFSLIILWCCVFVCVRLGYVDHAEELASRFLQCFPKNRLSAQAALNHEYFSNLPPRLWELQDSTYNATTQNAKQLAWIFISQVVVTHAHLHVQPSSGCKSLHFFFPSAVLLRGPNKYLHTQYIHHTC